jgi:hypothetical protein
MSFCLWSGLEVKQKLDVVGLGEEVESLVG